MRRCRARRFVWLPLTPNPSTLSNPLQPNSLNPTSISSNGIKGCCHTTPPPHQVLGVLALPPTPSSPSPKAHPNPLTHFRWHSTKSRSRTRGARPPSSRSRCILSSPCAPISFLTHLCPTRLCPRHDAPENGSFCSLWESDYGLPCLGKCTLVQALHPPPTPHPQPHHFHHPNPLSTLPRRLSWTTG